MMQPVVALVVAILVIAVAALIAWPRVGLWARFQTMRSRTARALIEDALKHLYDYEYKSVSCTLESLSGALSISSDDASRLVARLGALHLLAHKGQLLRLTPEGRSYALRVIRMHRLWERYLSDQTDLGEAEWHAKAEKQEHLLTPEQADALAERLGHPVFDPHGDPIPTAGGSIPPPQGMPLTSMKLGEMAGIVHVEDEPEAVYAQLVAQRLFPGMQVRMTDRAPERLLLEVDGNEVALAPVVAANVTVVPLKRAEQAREPFGTLSALRPGEIAVVRGISAGCHGVQRRRLMDLGVVPGTEVRAELESVSGDPVAYLIRGATIALRKQQAELIYVDKPKGKS